MRKLDRQRDKQWAELPDYLRIRRKEAEQRAVNESNNMEMETDECEQMGNVHKTD